MNEETNAASNEDQIGAMDDKSLETVRDILFGAQARENDKRAQHLEKLINNSVTKLERELDRKITAIEKSIDKLKDQLKREAESTAQKVDARFKDTAETISALDAKTQNELSELQDQTASDLASLEKQALNWNEDLAKQLELVQQQLQNSKMDRTRLSELLASMAVAIAEDGDG